MGDRDVRGHATLGSGAGASRSTVKRPGGGGSGSSGSGGGGGNAVGNIGHSALHPLSRSPNPMSFHVQHELGGLAPPSAPSHMSRATSSEEVGKKSRRSSLSSLNGSNLPGTVPALVPMGIMSTEIQPPRRPSVGIGQAASTPGLGVAHGIGLRRSVCGSEPQLGKSGSSSSLSQLTESVSRSDRKRYRVAKSALFDHQSRMGSGTRSMKDAEIDFITKTVPMIDELKQRLKAKRTDDRIRRWNLFNFQVAMLGTLMMMIQLEIGFNRSTAQLEPSELRETLKAGMSLTTIVLVTSIVMYYRFMLTLQSYQVGHLKRRSDFRSAGLLGPLVLELIVCSFHTPPYARQLFGDFLADTILTDEWGSLMILRLYLMGRLFRDYSQIYLQRRHIIRDERNVRASLVDYDWWLSVKAYFHRNPVSGVIISTGVVIMAFAYMLYVWERTLQPDAFTYHATVYFIAITMTTVGYGDMAPLTDVGRALGVITAIFGIILSALVVATTIAKLHLSHPQAFAVEWLAGNKMARMERDASVELLQHVARHWLHRKRAQIRLREAKKKPAWDKMSPERQIKLERRYGISKKEQDAYEGRLVKLISNLQKLRKRRVLSMVVDQYSVEDSVASLSENVEMIQIDLTHLMNSMMALRSEMRSRSNSNSMIAPSNDDGTSANMATGLTPGNAAGPASLSAGGASTAPSPSPGLAASSPGQSPRAPLRTPALKVSTSSAIAMARSASTASKIGGGPARARLSTQASSVSLTTARSEDNHAGDDPASVTLRLDAMEEKIDLLIARSLASASPRYSTVSHRSRVTSNLTGAPL